MASKRAGLSQSEIGKAVARPAANLVDNVFGGPVPPAVQEQKELTKREKEELAREQKKLQEAQEKEAKKRYLKFKTTERKTFVMDPISIEALRIFTFENRKGLSEAITDMMLRYIPREIWTEARNNVINIEETPKDYLESLKKLDIDSIYYHPYKPGKKEEE